jgi:hypothetical protein
MMFFSSKASRFVLVLAAACNPLTSATTMLRGNSPATAAVEDESLADDQHSRMLLEFYQGPQANLAVQSGAEIDFASPPSTIKGSVCADSSFTGDAVIPGLVGGHYVLEDTTATDTATAYTGGCGPADLIDLRTAAMNIIAKPMLSGAIGGLTFSPGTYSAASLTVADNTNVILKGGPDDIFLFQSGSYMVTGANTHFILETNGAEGDAGPQGKNILFALTAAATTGASTTLHGSILAGAAITLGAMSDVSGYVLATAAMTVGAECSLNSASITATTDNNNVVTSPILTLLNKAQCFTVDDAQGDPIFADCN